MTLSRVRNFGIVAHINAGKTTLTERILFDAGARPAMGEVDEGTSTMDWMPEEQQRGISIHAAVTQVRWKGYQLHLIDTPGHVDFTAEVERCLRVLDAVILVVDAVRGVESQTEIIWRQVQARGIPCLVFINKMDRQTSDYEASLISVSERLGCPALPLVLPERRDGELTALIDVVHDRVRGVSDAAPASWAPTRQAVVDACTLHDEGLLADYVEGREIDAPRLVASLRRATLACHVVPAMVGSALLNRGVDLLLDAVCLYLPSPLDRPAVTGTGDAGQVVTRQVDGPFCGLVFKLDLEEECTSYLLRIYSGQLAVGDSVVCSAPGGQRLQVASMFRVLAMDQEQIEQAQAGEVVAVRVDGELQTGDTLFDPDHPIRLEPVRFPNPVLTMVLEPERSADHGQVVECAVRLAREDPTLILQDDDAGGGLLVSGMGELHLQVFGDRLQAALRRSEVGLRLGAIRVLRRETLGRAVRVTGEARSRIAGEDRFVRVAASLTPDPGSGRLVIRVAEAASQVHPQLAAMMRTTLAAGLTGASPAADLVVDLEAMEGDFDPDEDDGLIAQALTIVARKAARAGVVTLEPVVDYDITMPPELGSGVLADLRARQARIGEVRSFGGMNRVVGQVRLAAMLGYSTQLRSLTRGLGTVSLTPHGFESAPPRAEKDLGKLDPKTTDR